ncbi:hypothetical protein L6270_04545 [Candidatus Parcubacteria bacterium]|nr:hypothetical protein [Patescibacteria group bacterium]MBU4309232.1 hypothetical protein [Patescibacteria group bacterium]MBU4432324.1 hypothetical protein [Patescibacteria group bacterium]MBU4577593.1 hypothetical protein [Patescibacteria group bacterium]MCG2697280.1 hypothetical protein [Candidatus Parcubacteria bacterium]
MEKKEEGFQNFGDILKSRQIKKAPAYQWQDFALQIIKELNIPPTKKGSVFKICKDRPRAFVEKCLNDTKELCNSKDKWRYFFKLASLTNITPKKD